jgi:U-box domain
MNDPVMINTGNTFEREAIVEHFEVNGYVDPLSNELVDPGFMEANVHL